MRDLTLSGRLPQFKQLTYVTSGIVYPIGGQIHRWLADTYGDWRVAMMYKELNRHDSFESAVLAVYGRTLDQLSDEFQLAMRRKYYPSVDSLAPLSVLAREVVELAVKPAFLPDTNGGAGEVVYVSPATGYVTIYRKQLEQGRCPQDRGRRAERRNGVVPCLRLADGRLPRRAAAVHRALRRPGRADGLGSRARQGRRSVSVHRAGLAALAAVDAGRPEHRAERAVRERRVRSLSRPPARWHARAADLRPLPGPGSRPRAPTDAGSCSRRTARRRASRARPISSSSTWTRRAPPSSPPATGGTRSPNWGPDGRVYFTSDRDGVLNVFSVDTLGEGRRETSAWSGAFDGVPLPDGSGLLVGGFHDLSWNLYRYPIDTLARQERFSMSRPDTSAQWTWLAAQGHRGQRGERRALPQAAHARLRRGRCRVHPGLRGGAGRVLRDERPAGRQPGLRLDLARSRAGGSGASLRTSARTPSTSTARGE